MLQLVSQYEPTSESDSARFTMYLRLGKILVAGLLPLSVMAGRIDGLSMLTVRTRCVSKRNQ